MPHTVTLSGPARLHLSGKLIGTGTTTSISFDAEPLDKDILEIVNRNPVFRSGQTLVGQLRDPTTRGKE